MAQAKASMSFPKAGMPGPGKEDPGMAYNGNGGYDDTAHGATLASTCCPDCRISGSPLPRATLTLQQRLAAVMRSGTAQWNSLAAIEPAADSSCWTGTRQSPLPVTKDDEGKAVLAMETSHVLCQGETSLLCSTKCPVDAYNLLLPCTPQC